MWDFVTTCDNSYNYYSQNLRRQIEPKLIIKTTQPVLYRGGRGSRSLCTKPRRKKICDFIAKFLRIRPSPAPCCRAKRKQQDLAFFSANIRNLSFIPHVQASEWETVLLQFPCGSVTRFIIDWSRLVCYSKKSSEKIPSSSPTKK